LLFGIVLTNVSYKRSQGKEEKGTISSFTSNTILDRRMTTSEESLCYTVEVLVDRLKKVRPWARLQSASLHLKGNKGAYPTQ